MSASTSQPGYKPRICVCVIMNHPFPQNIPAIRRLYRGRFSKVVFVMPFERSDDPDVFTVYRGGHTHAAFLTDIREKLLAIECDYFMIVHDDVLLNPTLSEDSFFSHIPLAPDDGFIPVVMQPGAHVGHHSWYLGVIGRLIFPRSPLFGSGMNTATLVKYMPPVERVRAKLDKAGVRYQERVILDDQDFYNMIVEGSRALLHGHAVDTSLSPNAAANNAYCTEILRQIIEAMAMGIEAESGQGRLDRGMTDAGRDIVLPFPIAYSSHYTDFYILPRSKLAEFAHYIGVWSATGALIEFAVGTILHVCCDRVWTGPELGLTFSFFEEKHSVGYFEDPKFMAIHPFKLSAYNDRAKQDDLFRALDNLARGEAWPPRVEAGDAYPLTDLVGDYHVLGWHGFEGWGRWQMTARATLPFKLAGEGPVDRIAVLLIRSTALDEPFGGSVGLGGEPAQHFEIPAGTAEIEIMLDAAGLDPEAAHEIVIVSDRVVRPADATGGIGDLRTLGFGLLRVAFLAPEPEAAAAPPAEAATAAG